MSNILVPNSQPAYEGETEPVRPSPMPSPARTASPILKDNDDNLSSVNVLSADVSSVDDKNHEVRWCAAGG